MLRTFALLAACAALTAVVACGCSTTTNTMNTVTTPATTSPEAKDDAYIALLAKWAKRDGWQMGDRDQLIAAGGDVCGLLDHGETSVISASRLVMDKYQFSGQVASAVGVAATETLCPEHRP